MRAINHSLTGALIGLSVADPLVAIPMAVASHFVLDSVPHFGHGSTDDDIVTPTFIAYIVVDAVLCGILVVILVLNRPFHWPLAVICAFLAAAPDFFSFNRFYKTLKGLPWRPSWYARFATAIQWFEKPIGIVVEAVWLVSMVFCLSIF